MATHDSNGTSAGQVHTLPPMKGGALHGPEVGHGHGHSGADHVPHVLPISIYLATWATLILLTVVTVAASYFSFGTWNLVIALFIATAKASVVAAIFMHLRYDRKFHSIIFGFSLIFLGIFIMFTMFDTETRGRTDAVEGDRPVSVTTPFAGGKAERDMKARYEKKGTEGEKKPPAAAAPTPAAAPGSSSPH